MLSRGVVGTIGNIILESPSFARPVLNSLVERDRITILQMEMMKATWFSLINSKNNRKAFFDSVLSNVDSSVTLPKKGCLHHFRLFITNQKLLISRFGWVIKNQFLMSPSAYDYCDSDWISDLYISCPTRQFLQRKSEITNPLPDGYAPFYLSGSLSL